MTDWDYPKLKIKPPSDALTQGLPPVPHGMLAWRNRKNKYTVLCVGFYSDPIARTKEWWESATEGMQPNEIDTEYLCSFSSRGGQRVFPALSKNPEKFSRSSRNYREGPIYKIPEHWHLIGGMDYGGNRNPTSFNIFAIDENKNFHCIYEFYKPAHFREIAEAVTNHPLYNRLIKICLDSTAFKRDQHDQNTVGAFTSIAELLQDAGVHILERANNDRQAGLARFMDLYNQRPGEERPSRFFISDDCPNLFNELSELVYKQETQQQLMHANPSEDVEKKNDHGYDSMRYAIMGFDSEAEFIAPKPQSPFALANIESEIDDHYDSQIDDLFN